MKKRMLALLLTAIMLLGIIPMTTAFAEDKESFVIQVGNTEIKKGDGTAAVKISVPENPGVWGVRVYLCYDKDLTIGDASNVTAGDMFPGVSSSDIVEGDTDLDSVSFAASYSKFADAMAASGHGNTGYNVTCIGFEPDSADDNVTAEDGTLLATVNFTVKPGSSKTSYEVFAVVDSDDIFRYDPESDTITTYNVECRDGSVKVVEDRPVVETPTFMVSNATISEGDPEAQFTLSLLGNPGKLYSVAGYIGYDKPMKLKDFFLCGILDDTNFLADPMRNLRAREIDVEAADEGSGVIFEKGIKASFAAAGIDTANKYAAYFYTESEDFENGIDGDGECAKFTFDTSALEAGEYDITFCVLPGNSIDVDGNDVEAEYIQGTLHVHGWEPTDNKQDATCTDSGWQEYGCKFCDETKQETLPALGHGKEVESVDEATCTDPEVTHYNCPRCHQTPSEEVTGSALGHSKYVESVEQATCTTPEITHYNCSRCHKDPSQEQTKPALGHGKEVESVDEATCTTPEITHYNCPRCHQNPTQEQTKDALGHHMVVDYVEEATCTTPEITHYKCDRNNDNNTQEQTKDALGHEWVEDTDLREEPTCTATGTAHFYCTRCSEVKTEEIAALGHEWVEDEDLREEPTCTEAGSAHFHCSRCDEEKTEALAALGHDWDEGVVTTPATTESEGVKTYTCKRCGETKTEAVAKLPATTTPGGTDNNGGSDNNQGSGTGTGTGSGNTNSQTGDSIIGLSFVAAISLITLTAFVVVKKKIFSK